LSCHYGVLLYNRSRSTEFHFISNGVLLFSDEDEIYSYNIDTERNLIDKVLVLNSHQITDNL